MHLLSEMKTKKQNNQSQPFELIFPEMYQTHPWPFLQVQPDPFVILAAAEAIYLYGIKTMLTILRPHGFT